jgi:putative ABC transport system ATP-binding protein
MLELKNLEFNYRDKPIAYPDWRVDANGQALILGNSGSGKTTLLHLVCGLLKPTNGTITINDQSLTALSAKKLDRFRGEHFGIVFQRPHLIKSLTVIENLKLALHLSGKRIQSKKYDQVLDSLNMAEFKDRKVHQLSEGQAQRVSIARAVVHDPILLAADEPTASLDDENCANVLNLLTTQAKEHDAMLIIATHDQRIKDEFSNQLVL